MLKFELFIKSPVWRTIGSSVNIQNGGFFCLFVLFSAVISCLQTVSRARVVLLLSFMVLF